jgi:hypothetical protein
MIKRYQKEIMSVHGVKQVLVEKALKVTSPISLKFCVTFTKEQTRNRRLYAKKEVLKRNN